MNSCLLFLLIITTVTAVTTKTQEQRILQEIMDYMTIIPTVEAHELWVKEAVNERHCTLTNLCKAGRVLEKFNATGLGLQEHEWKLPRLLSNLQHKNCTKPGNDTTSVRLSRLLREIHKCAKKQFSLQAH